MVWCNTPEELNFQHHCCENLKSALWYL